MILGDQIRSGCKGIVEDDSLRPREPIAANRRLRCRWSSRQQRRAQARGRREIGADAKRYAHGAFEIDFACALFECIKVRKLLRGVHEDGLDEVRRQLRVCLQ